MARSKVSGDNPLHRSPLTSVKAGALRSCCHRLETVPENSGSSETMTMVGWVTCSLLRLTVVYDSVALGQYSPATSNSGAVEAAGAVGAAAALAFRAGFAVGFTGADDPKAASTMVRRSASTRMGCPEEYSAWNMTFQDWQIMRTWPMDSDAENWAAVPSMVTMPRDSSSRNPSRIALMSPCIN